MSKRPPAQLWIIAAIYIASIIYAGIGIYHAHIEPEKLYCFDEIVRPILGD